MAPGRALPPRRLYRHKPGAVTRAGRGLLQPSRHLRAVHQRGKGRDQVDPAVMPHLRRQRRPPSTSCARLQSGQLHADAGDTRSDQGLVADQLEGKADQDWREGRQPWALRGLPTRRGRGVAADVRGYPVADRPVADTTRPGMTGRRSQMRQSTTAEARLDGGKQRVPAPRAHAARHFCCQRADCYRISLRRRRDDGKIIPTEPGIWGMSAQDATGYIRVDWFTPDGLPTWGDGRLVILGTEGYIELRKYVDLAGQPGADHLLLVDRKGVHRIDCSTVELPYGRHLVQDILQRTEKAMPQARCFKAMELALRAQALAERF